MDENTMRTILDSFTNQIEEISDKKLDLRDKKLNTINRRLDNSDIHIDEVKDIAKTNTEDINILQEETNKNTEQTINNRNKIHMNDMRIRELEEELELKNNAETNRLNQLYSTVGVLKAQISDLTSKTNARPNSEPKKLTPNYSVVQNVTKNNKKKADVEEVVRDNLNNAKSSPINSIEVPNPSPTPDNITSNPINQAKRVVGLYPINRSHIAHWVLTEDEVRNIPDDDIFRNDKYSEARTEAANDFLYSKLSLRIGEVDILKTKMCNNPYSSILWVTLSKQTDVTKIFRRAAQLKMKNIRIMTFFPSSIWPRKMSVEKNMAKARQTNKDLKYQIRLGNNDIQLLIKDNHNPVWTRVDIDKYGPVADLPEDFKEQTNNSHEEKQAETSNNSHEETQTTTPNNSHEETQTKTSKKRKDITPLKTDTKKNKEDIEQSDTTTDTQKDDGNEGEQTGKTEDKTTDAMDTEIELAAEVIKKNIN